MLSKKNLLLLTAIIFCFSSVIVAQSFSWSGPTNVTINYSQTNAPATYYFTYNNLSGLCYPGLIIAVNGNVINNDLCHNPSTPSSYTINFTEGTHTVKFSLLSINCNTSNCYHAIIHKVYEFTVTVNFKIRHENIFTYGTIYVDNYTTPKSSPYDRTSNPNNSYSIGAIDQGYGGYNWIWNTSGVNNSKWKRVTSDGSEYNYSYDRNTNYTVQTNDKNTKLIAELRKLYSINRTDQTEFDGTISVGVVAQIVEQNSGQISAPAQQTINGRTYNFAGWTDGNGDNPRTIWPDNNQTYTALYKMIQKSNNPNAYSNNNQRKIVRTPDGILHSVYESINRVWYERSTDNGNSWIIGNNGKPLSNQDSKSPSITYYGNQIAIVWQEKFGNVFKIKVGVFGNNNYTTALFGEIATENNLSFSYNAEPVITIGYQGRTMVVWRGYDTNCLPSGGYALRYSTGYASIYGITFNQYCIVANSNSNSDNPTLAVDLMRQDYPIYYQLAWEQANEIYYCKLVEDANGNIAQTSNSVISNGSSYMFHTSPSIIAIDTTARVCWNGYDDEVPPNKKVLCSINPFITIN